MARNRLAVAASDSTSQLTSAFRLGLVRIRRMRQFGKILQWIGLAVPPIAMYMEITGTFMRDGVADLLLAMVASVCAFFIGRIIEGYAGQG